MSRFKILIRLTAAPKLRGRLRQRQLAGFTVIELLTVMMVIGILSGIGLSIGGAALRNAAIQQTRVELAALQTALEAYKLDNGAYPASTLQRISVDGSAEWSNSAALYVALAGASRKYIKLKPKQLLTKDGVTVIVDGFGRPLNYYCTSPVMSDSSISANVIIGGQVNVTSYDLFSYGPDGATFAGTTFGAGTRFAFRDSSRDDIWNSR